MAMLGRGEDAELEFPFGLGGPGVGSCVSASIQGHVNNWVVIDYARLRIIDLLRILDESDWFILGLGGIGLLADEIRVQRFCEEG